MLVLLPLVLLQIRASTITTTFPPTPIKEALRLLSNASGERLMADPALSEEVVLARLKYASVETALSHLAEALCAKWKKRSDGATWLVPDVQAKEKLDRAEASESARHLDTALSILATRLKKQPLELDQGGIEKYRAKTADVEKQRQAAREALDSKNMFVDPSVDEESPAWRAMVRLSLLLDRKHLLAMSSDSRVVYAEDPTPMQLAFPEAAEAILAQYRREFRRLDPLSGIMRVELSIKKADSIAVWFAILQALDSSGKSIDKVQTSFDDRLRPMLASPNNATSTRRSDEQPLPIPDEAQKVRIALSQAYKGPDRAKILEKCKPRLMDPARFEPTRWYAGEDLILAADAVDKNLIGTVSDVLNAFNQVPQKLRASEVLAKYSADLIPSSDGWLVPCSRLRSTRVSRSKAKSLLAQCEQDGGLSIDEAAAWIGQSPTGDMFNNWTRDYIKALFAGRGAFSGSKTFDYGYELQMWESLGDKARNSLRKGETIRFSTLPPQAISQIEHFVYWYEDLDDGPVDTTDAQPNGITDGNISLSISEKPVFYGWSSKDGPPATPWFMDAKAFGSYLVVGNPMVDAPADSFSAYDSFRVGAHRVYDLHFAINPGAAPMLVRLRETLFDPKAETLTQLPDAILADVEKAKQDAFTHPASPRRRVIPPK